jgi:DNA-binding CsgD family transcriptional regulator
MPAPAPSRQQQFEQIQERLLRLESGLGGAVLILGEAGLGKTHMLDQLATISVRMSAHVVRINADELDSLAPLSTLTRGLSDSSNGLEVDFLEAHQASPAGIWLLREIQSLFERISAHRPLMVAIDDVDRADDMSLHAVRLLSASLDSSPVFWILTARGEGSPALAELRTTLVANDQLVVALAALSHTESVDLVTSLLGGTPPAPLLHRTHDAGGNPFLLSELTRGYQEIAGRPGLAQESGLPDRVREAARARVASLDPVVRAVLDVAAVIGRAFSVENLTGATGQSLVQILSAIRQLQRLSVILDSGDHFVFRHELLRESILADMPADARKALHREVAALLLKRGHPPADVARHLLAGVGASDVVMAEPLIEAGEKLATSAPSAAQELAERALEVSTHERRLWLDVASRAIAIHIGVGDLAAASALMESAVDRGLSLDHEAAARAQLFDALWRAGRTTDGTEVLRPVLGRSGLSPASVLRLEVVLARTRVLADAPAEAAELLAKVAAEARELSEHETVDYALAARSMALRFIGDIAGSIEVAREAVTSFDGSAWSGVDPRIWLARSLTAGNRLDEAEDLCGRVLRSTSGPNGSRDLPLVSATLARLLMAKGRVIDALTEAESGIAAMEAGGGRQLAAELFACAAAAAWLSEGPERAALLLEGATAFIANNAYGMSHLEMARLIVEEGDPRNTAKLVAPVLRQLAHSYGQLVFDPTHAPALVRRLLSADIRSQAALIVDASERLASQNAEVSAWTASARHATGLLVGDVDRLVMASTEFTESGRPLAAASAKADAATLLAGRGDHAAPETLRQAVVELRDVGAFAAADRLLRSAPEVTRPRRRAAQRPQTGWAALTPAELRVVELAARGATNKEIAQELWLSPYTVDTHMRHSLAKLGLRSRVALARLAAERESAQR